MKTLVKNGVTYKGTKRYLEMLNKYDRNELFSVEDGAKQVIDLSTAKFDESIELSYKLNIKQKHNIRDVLVLPHTIGKEKRVLVFAEGDKAKEAEAAGATYVGGQDLVDKILGGWFEFDAVIATPDMMKILGKLGPALGRKKMMPNPKVGTVTTDIARVVNEYKAGRTEVRADKTGNIHVVVGKKSSGADVVRDNTLAIHKLLMKVKPTDLKGDYMATMTLSPTMGSSVLIDHKKISV